jgi:hypothetical protein
MTGQKPSRCGVLLLFAVGCAVAGCANNFRGTALYPGVRRERSEVAQLVGPITSVDSIAVPNQHGAFELLPGCHIVEIGGSFGGSYGGSAWAVWIPNLLYAIEMQAQGRYTIEDASGAAVGLAPSMASRVIAREEDAKGKVRVLRPAKSAELQKCGP